MRILDMELELEALRKFKEWCIYDLKHFMPPEKWELTSMKKKLDELGLDDDYGDDV